MSKQTDLREIQRLTEDAAIDARKLLIQADNLPPGAFQRMLEALCGSFEDTALQLRRLCEQQSPGTGGYKRGRALRPLEVVGSVERIGIDWLHIRINTLLPHCRFQPPTWLTETLVELLDAYIEAETPNRFFTKTGQSAVLPQKAKSVGYIRPAKPFAGKLFRALVPARSGGKTAFYGEPTDLMRERRRK